MDILKNDVIYILSEKQNSKSERNRQFTKFPGPDKQISQHELGVGAFNPTPQKIISCAYSVWVSENKFLSQN